MRQAEAALQEAELALAYTVVSAPFDGIIGKKGVEAGANVSAGQPLFALAADTDNWVIANFKETQIGRIQPGDRAEIRVDAFPGRSWRGHVESISPATGAKYALLPPDNATGNFTKVVQRVPVKIAIDGIDEDDEPSGSDRRRRLAARRSLGERRCPRPLKAIAAARTTAAAPAPRLPLRDRLMLFGVMLATILEILDTSHRERGAPEHDGEPRRDGRRDLVGRHELHHRQRDRDPDDELARRALRTANATS